MLADVLAARTPVLNELILGYDELTDADVAERAARLPRKVVRWLATLHPDARLRRLLFQATGVEIGEGTYINSNLALYDEYQGLIRFGARVAVAHNVTIVASSNPNNSRLAELPHVRDHLIITKPVTICDDVWLGTGAIILPGVTVGRGAVVGAGALVREDIPPFAVVAGSPARIVKQLPEFSP
jgi:acetyltransferase-like isoleucine patch superfamily enzyme